MNQPNVTLPYRTPRERATARLLSDLADQGIALAIVLLGLCLGFLMAGNFGGEAVRALGLAALIAVVKAATTYLMHLQRARAEDAALSP